MRLFGFSIERVKAQVSSVSSGAGWRNIIREPFTGAWQRNREIESTSNLLAFGAVYSCVSRISDDISKLRIKLVEQDANGIWAEVDRNSPFMPVLKKPNRYQTRIQFLSSWISSKLLYGNAYIYKEFDDRGIVVAMHVLDPRNVSVLVATDGSIYYQLGRDDLSGLSSEAPAIPSRWIIHDRMITLWHPLIGVSPIYACGSSATHGIRIQANSAAFFENMSRPSGHISAPETISDEVAERLKREFEANFSGGNIGRLLVTGDGLKYEPMTIPAQDAQLIEQLRWTVEDVARCFHVPLHKIGAGNPTFANIGSLNQDYYTQTLQALIEALELSLDEGLGLTGVTGKIYGVELDIEALLRMDPAGRAEANDKAIKAGYLAPNEARLRDNLGPVEGGGTPYLQQQNYSLSALAKRDASEDPFSSSSPSAPEDPRIEPEPKGLSELDRKDFVIAVTRGMLQLQDCAALAE